MNQRVSIEERYNDMRCLLEDEFRKELERQRTCLNSLMTDGRIRGAKLDEEVCQLNKAVASLQVNRDVVDSIRKTLDLIEVRNHDM